MIYLHKNVSRKGSNNDHIVYSYLPTFLRVFAKFEKKKILLLLSPYMNQCSPQSHPFTSKYKTIPVTFIICKVYHYRTNMLLASYWRSTTWFTGTYNAKQGNTWTQIKKQWNCTKLSSLQKWENNSIPAYHKLISS